MASTAEHYAGFLAPIYVWMAGGVAHALGVGAADLAALMPGTRMLVRDLLHEREVGRGADGWRLTSSSYFKLRLEPESVRRALERAGLAARCEPGPRGMVRVTGVRR